MRTILGSAILLLALSLVPACGNDPTSPPPDPAQVVQPLTTRSAVLNNIEVAYNKRNPEVIDALLDGSFTFFLSPGDVGGGLPVQWGRSDELEVTTRLFLSNGNSPGNGPVCLSIKLDIVLDDEIVWQPVVPEAFPDETWYATTVVCSGTFKMEPDQTYVTRSGYEAQFTVRNVGSGGVQDWRLIEWRDLGGSFATSSGQVADKNVTLGAIKALYK